MTTRCKTSIHPGTDKQGTQCLLDNGHAGAHDYGPRSNGGTSPCTTALASIDRALRQLKSIKELADRSITIVAAANVAETELLRALKELS